MVTILAPGARPLHELVTKAVARRLGRTARLTSAGSYRPFLEGDFDIGLVCGLPYVWLRERDPDSLEALAAPVLSDSRAAGRPVYFSDVVVRHDRPWRSLGELAGRTWGFNEPASHSGNGVVAWTLARRGLDWSHFARVTRVGYHTTALAMVADGKIDGAAIDSHVLWLERRRNPDLGRTLRVIESLGPSTIQPVVAGPGLSRPARKAAREALAALAEEPAAARVLRDLGVERLVAVGDSDYDDIRAMSRAATGAGLLSPAALDQDSDASRATQASGS